MGGRHTDVNTIPIPTASPVIAIGGINAIRIKGSCARFTIAKVTIQIKCHGLTLPLLNPLLGGELARNACFVGPSCGAVMLTGNDLLEK